VRVFAFPCDDTNLHQSLLYGKMQCRGVRVTYLVRLTPLQVLSLVLPPFELAVRSLAGALFLHLHWTFTFSMPCFQRFPMLRKVALGWSNSRLRTTRLLGMHLVWTEHIARVSDGRRDNPTTYGSEASLVRSLGEQGA
jgi:hypothetical protein